MLKIIFSLSVVFLLKEAQANPALMLQALLAPRGACNPLSSSWTPKWANIVQYWRLVGPYGSIANSTSIPAAVGTSGTFSNVNNSVSPTTGYVTGMIDTAIRFDGADDYVTTAYTQTAVTAYSIQAWINTTSAVSQKVIVNNRGSGAGMSLTLGINYSVMGTLFFALDSNSIIRGRRSTALVNDGNWHHVVGTWTAPASTSVSETQFNLYIDGSPAATANITTGTSTSPLTGLGNTHIGYSQPWTSYFPGLIQEVAIWNAVLTPTDVATLYQRQTCLTK